MPSAFVYAMLGGALVGGALAGYLVHGADRAHYQRLVEQNRQRDEEIARATHEQDRQRLEAANRAAAIARTDYEYLASHPPAARVVRLCRASVQSAAAGATASAGRADAAAAVGAGDPRGVGAVEISTEPADRLMGQCAALAADYRDLQERVRPVVEPK